MSKNLSDKKVNRNIKKLNRLLRQDVFKDRFEARQVKKSKTPYGLQFYMYELRDNLQPERNTITKWYSEGEIVMFHSIWYEMNQFIIQSDFWEKHNRESCW